MQKLLIIILSMSLSACHIHRNEHLSKQNQGQRQSQAMVVTANPLATKAGADMLRAGGSAVDAAISIQAVLSLVEPQSSGLAGGGFMLHFDNDTNEIDVYDGRETAPALIDDKQFLNPDGEPIGYFNAKHSGLSTGVPGIVSLLHIAHSDHGELTWGSQLNAAKRLATEGFAVSPRLNYMIKRFDRFLPKSRKEGPIDAYEYFYDDRGEPLAVGSTLKNIAYAKTLESIAKNPRSFYVGEIANQIVQQTELEPRKGRLSLADLANFKAQKRNAYCSNYKGKQLCGPPPPSSWVTVGQIMGLLAVGDGFNELGAESASNWVAFAEAQRLAYADRDQYIGDDAFVAVPVNGILSPDYWKMRKNDANQSKAAESLKPGNPWAFASTSKVAYGHDLSLDDAGTTHFVVVDGNGDVVSMTSSVESIFGSTRMAGGMFLNNQLSDFSFKPSDANGKPVVNRIQPGKRPRSSMSPTIVLDEQGEFLMASGSPGGSSIIAYTAKTLVGVLDWGLSPQQAVDLPNLVARKESVRIEKSRASEELITGLRDYGFNVKESAGENSGLSVVLKTANGQLVGGVDSRREGTVETVDFIGNVSQRQ